MGQHLIVQGRGDGVWSMTLHRQGRANALSSDLVSQIRAALADLKEKQARVVVIQSAEKAFCAGFDFGDVSKHSIGDLLYRFVSIELMLQEVRGHLLSQSPVLMVRHMAQGQIWQCPALGDWEPKMRGSVFPAFSSVWRLVPDI